MKNIRYTYFGLLFLTYLVITQIVRVVLLWHVGPTAVDSWFFLPALFFLGALNDIPPFLLVTLPLAGFIFFIKQSLCKGFLLGSFILYTAFFLFVGVSEYTFWEELNCRFNFIAIDYLIYTTEVIKNIFESYPVGFFLVGIGICAVVVSVIVLYPYLKGLPLEKGKSRASKWVFIIWLLGAPLPWMFSTPQYFNNVLTQQIASNGIWELCLAFKNNQLDYAQFYPLLDDEEALLVLHNELVEAKASFITTSPVEWRRKIHSLKEEKKLNVVQIIIESLGTASLGARTPYLNTIANESLSFTGMKATGTRTVRALEALMLSIPPTPGSSVVRRPNNDGLFNAGTIFKQKGYDIAFIYGGYGYFDNMNAFFSGNGFRIIDRANIPDKYKTFANAWGICDGDLFNVALHEADVCYSEGRPFYQVLLTTSNHRPFTYPEGCVDIPSGTNRSGAIKYTDYAVKKFIEAAKVKPWFKDTIFVIIADHTAGCAGKTVLPPEEYEIPCFIYSPAHVPAQKNETLCSQIDVAPTLFALLGWEYTSGFFGKNILDIPSGRGRAWIGTYQMLGFLTDSASVVLEPLKNPSINMRSPYPCLDKENTIKQAIATYQSAYKLFTDGMLKEDALLQTRQ